MVYILTSSRAGTLYVGVTSNLLQRLHQHRHDLVPGFTERYAVHRLVWFEAHETMASAILREKRIKHWIRDWKLNLIETQNSEWLDLAVGLGFQPLAATANGSPPTRG